MDEEDMMMTFFLFLFFLAALALQKFSVIANQQRQTTGTYKKAVQVIPHTTQKRKGRMLYIKKNGLSLALLLSLDLGCSFVVG